MCGLFEPGARKPQEGSPEEGAEDDKNDGHGAKLSGPEGGGKTPIREQQRTLQLVSLGQCSSLALSFPLRGANGCGR